jgi:hypothetical protein
MHAIANLKSKVAIAEVATVKEVGVALRIEYDL